MPLYFIRNVNKSGWSGVVVKACSCFLGSEFDSPTVTQSLWYLHQIVSVAATLYWEAASQILILYCKPILANNTHDHVDQECSQPLHNAPFINHFTFQFFQSLHMIKFCVTRNSLSLNFVFKNHKRSFPKII